MSRKLYNHLITTNYQNMNTKIRKQIKPFKTNTKKRDSSL